MNLRSSATHSGYTADSEVELDSSGTMQTATLRFCHTFNQGLDEFGNSLVVDEQRSVGSVASSRRSGRDSMCSESTEEGQNERNIALSEYVVRV